MNIAQLSNQIVLMFCLMAVGVLINKLHFMSADTSSDLTNILLYIVSPCLIIQAFEQKYSSARMQELLVVMLGVCIVYIVSIVISNVCFAKTKDQTTKRAAIFGSIFSNAGFMGVPLAAALFGNKGVFFAVASLAGYSLFNWTYGVTIFKEKREFSWMNLREQAFNALVNPNIIAIFVGGLVFVCSFKIPEIINRPATYLSSLNTPLSMIVIGNSLANSRFSKEDFNKSLLGALFLRNLVYPMLTYVVLLALGLSGVSLLTTVLLFACPTAGLVVLFSLQANDNPTPGIALMTMSTVLSIATIPLVFFLMTIF